MGIKQVRKINKGGVLMKLTSNKDFEKLQIEINSNDNLKGNFTVRKAAKIKPKVNNTTYMRT